MKFYYLVDKISSDIETGIYGRRKYTEEEKKDLSFNDYLSILNIKSDKALFVDTALLLLTPLYGLKLIKRGFKNYNKIKNNTPLTLIEKSNANVIIIPAKLLENDYSINDELGILKDAFSKFNNSINAFEKLMKSSSDTSLIITEKALIDKKHFGGISGSFETGLYCEHPKNNEILIPLNKSKEILKDLILEEIINAYEALGAKTISISDILNISSKQNGGGVFNNINLKGDANQQYTKSIVRKKEYGMGVFDSKRALKNKFFIHDLPNIMSTIDGRINGNQTYDSFNEVVDLSGGMNIDVLDIFNAGASFKYKKEWHIEVEFYDKNTLKDAYVS